MRATTSASPPPEARRLTGEMVGWTRIRAGEGKLGLVLRLPVGVVGAISPFNFPLNLVAHKLGPAIAAGCPVVLKPAVGHAAVGAAAGAVLFEDGGLPPRLAERRRPASRRDIGDVLIEDPG